MGKNRFFILMFFLFSSSFGFGKDILIEGKGKKLNVLLNELAERYDLLISFDDARMSSIQIPDNKSFSKLSNFFSYLQQHHYIKIDTVENSYVFSRLERKNYTYHGKVLDATTNEALPNAEIICEPYHIYSNPQGYFTFLSSEDTLKTIQVRHLGYIVLDTIISAKSLAKIVLHSQVTSIDNVVVKSRMKSYNVNVGSRPGGLKLTPEFMSKLPGYGESSMYTFLKLMPGVLATGESANDMSLRGSSEGQNLYLFDHYRIYNPWYRLSEIGTINPLMIKDVEVYKSGLDVSVGEHVGGVVMLKGKEAISPKVKGQVFLNNFVSNAMLEVPMGQKIALLFAARKNVRKQLVLPDAIAKYVVKNILQGFATNYQVNINPTYDLYDGNFKLLYKPTPHSNLSVSGFGSFEKNKLDNITLTNAFKLRNRQERNNKQYAAALHYDFYSERGQLALTASYSSIRTRTEGAATLVRLDKEEDNIRELNNEESGFLQEFRMKAKYRIPFANFGNWECGLGFTSSNTKDMWQKEDEKWLKNKWHQLSYAFLNSNLSFGTNWNIIAGGRINYFHALHKPTFEPRFILNYYFDDNWKFYGSYGVFQQFVYKAHVFDRLKNIRYRSVSADENIPILKVNDLCVGVRYASAKWTASTELFCKYTDERIRATYGNIEVEKDEKTMQKVVTEKLRYAGGDLFLKYQNNGFVSWFSLTISDFSILNSGTDNNTEKYNAPTATTGANDSFDFGIGNNKYTHSDYDMRQEFKWAAAYTWRKLTLSAAYVYGSGFRLWQQPDSSGVPDYSRFDLGVSYKLKLKTFATEAGCSVLNLLNRKNKRLDEFSRFGVGDDIVSYNTYGLGFTPAFYLKIAF